MEIMAQSTLRAGHVRSGLTGTTGDYVDRGLFSIETISLLICLKLRYPDRVHLIRGNHESRGVTQSYGFYTECSRKYGNAAVWHYFTDMFDYLSLSCVIDDKIFCVHGGLSPSIHSIDQIKIIDRFREIPHEGPMADLVWSDPDAERDEFSLSPRGAGYTFGAQVVKKFLEVNSMNHILRAHQLCNEGYMVMFDDQLSTVWSAPNYCYRCGNLASVLEVVTVSRSIPVVTHECPGRFGDRCVFERESGIDDRSVGKYLCERIGVAPWLTSVRARWHSASEVCIVDRVCAVASARDSAHTGHVGRLLWQDEETVLVYGRA